MYVSLFSVWNNVSVVSRLKGFDLYSRLWKQQDSDIHTNLSLLRGLFEPEYLYCMFIPLL